MKSIEIFLKDIEDENGWVSIRFAYPLIENAYYEIRDCRWSISGKAFYNGYDFIKEEWDNPTKGSLFLATYKVTHWKQVK